MDYLGRRGLLIMISLARLHHNDICMVSVLRRETRDVSTPALSKIGIGLLFRTRPPCPGTGPEPSGVPDSPGMGTAPVPGIELL